MTVPIRHWLVQAQLWWGVQGLDRAGDELCPSPDVQPLPVAPASGRAGVGMLLPGAVRSASSAREQIPVVCRAVSHAPFTTTKIQIRQYQGELHASIACLIKSFTLCSWGMRLVIYFRLRDNWFFFYYFFPLSALVQASGKLPKPSAAWRVSPACFLCWQHADFCWSLIKLCSWGLAFFTLLIRVLAVLVSPSPSRVPALYLLCPLFPLAPKPHPNSPGSAWGKSGGIAAVPQDLASAFVQAPAPPGLKLNLRTEEKQEVVAMCCIWYSAGKTGHRGSLCWSWRWEPETFSAKSWAKICPRTAQRSIRCCVTSLPPEKPAFSCSCGIVTCPIPSGHPQPGACRDKCP